MPFQPRNRYTVPILGVVILLMLIATWLPSQLMPEPDICFASLFWYITRYGNLGLVMLSTIAAMMLVSAITIFVRLSNSNLIDEDQRIAASRMVYYLILGIISLVCLCSISHETRLTLIGIYYSLVRVAYHWKW
jgi:hypothetical protein